MLKLDSYPNHNHNPNPTYPNKPPEPRNDGLTSVTFMHFKQHTIHGWI